MLVNLVEILKLAEEKRCAIGAFNTPNLESLQAVIGAAEELKGEKFGLLRGERVTDSDEIEIIFDTCIAEVFADGGVRCATAPVFPVKPYTMLKIEGAEAQIAKLG